MSFTKLIPWLCGVGLLFVLVIFSTKTKSERVRDARQIVGDDAIVLLSASWCGYCRKERADLERWGIDFTEFDIDTDSRGRAAYESLGGRGVPTTLIGQQFMVGYGPDEMRRMISAELDKDIDF